MLNLISLLIGVISLILVVVAFIPFLGAFNWLVVPFAVVGLALGAMSKSQAGRNLNIVVVVIGVVRLMGLASLANLTKAKERKAQQG